MINFHYRQVKLKTIDIIEIEETLTEAKVGTRPCFIDASKLPLEQLMELLSNLSTVFKYLNFHPKFPYPCFVITELIDDHELFPIAKSELDLPKHFNQTTKRLSPRESLLQNKIKILQKRLININFYEKVDMLKAVQNQQKQLANTAKEEYFYHQILESIRENNKLKI